MLTTPNSSTCKHTRHKCINFLLWLIFCISAFSYLNGFAQVSKPDSLEIAAHINQSHDKLVNRDYSDAIAIAQFSLEKSVKLDFKWGIINSLLIIAQAHKSLLNYPSSLNHYLQALPEIQKRNDRVALQWVNSKVGELFQEWGVPEKALPYYNAAVRLHEEIIREPSAILTERIAEVHLKLKQIEQALVGYFQLLQVARDKNDVRETSRILYKIATIYVLSNDTENSLKYNLQLLELNKQAGDNLSTATSLNIIGNQYKELKNFDKALEYYQAALSMNRKVNKDGDNDNRMVTNLINIGTIFQLKADNRNAIKSLEEALEIKRRTGTPVEIAVMHNYLASLYLAQGNFSEAERQTKKSIALLSNTDNKRALAANYKRLSEIYGRQSNYEKALVSYQVYTILKDSLVYHEQLAHEKERLKEYVIETTEKEAKLSLIDHEIQALELRNQREIAEREKQDIALLLKEKEFQNLSLQKSQLEQAREVQQLELLRAQIAREKQEQEILLLEQKQELQYAELEKNELLEVERQQEIAFKNAKLELQQSALDHVAIRQQYLIYTAILFFAIIVLVLVGYIIKRRDNRKLQIQYAEINKQKEQIESINKSLVELNEEKNDLIGIVAHDLKSPLNQISGMLEIIKLTNRDQPTEQQEFMIGIEKSTNRLKKMVSKILDVNAIESKALNIKLEQINITELLQETVNRFTVLAEKKSITIVTSFDNDVPVIISDAGYVSEVLENLMSNAVKYSPLEKQVTIKLSKRGAFVRIEFIDQGLGISAADMKKLFGKFHKLTARPTAGEDSTGLGLSIVKKYVQALNGAVWCESEEGKGANFIVELPV
jgi:signal transduction histidine kinase